MAGNYRNKGLNQPEKIIKNMIAQSSVHSLCWLGNNGWIINYKGCMIAFDLDLLDSYRLQASPVNIAELAPYLDYLFITHEHNDHFHDSTAKALHKESHCTFILPESCLKKANELGVTENRYKIAYPGRSFYLGDLLVEPLHALHGHLQNSVYKDANFKDCGYVLKFGDKRIFQPGDTVLLQEHLELADIDILFVSPTEHNMQVINSVNMIKSINPRLIFPQHFDTYPVDAENYFWTHGYPDELYYALPDQFKLRYHKLLQGEIYTIK